jgi:hypothetical protein
MINVYFYDENKVYIKTEQISIYDAMPKNCTLIEPPIVTEPSVAVWFMNKWITLPSKPPINNIRVTSIHQKRKTMKVTMRQARLALFKANLLSSVDNTIDLLDDPYKSEARIEWEYAQEVERLRPFVIMLGPLLGLSDDQLDDLFIFASRL